MFQKFYTDTLGSRFIKSLLAQTPIPIFDAVTEGDLLVTGCYYVYKQFIIRCASGGLLLLNPAEQQLLYPSDTLYPSVALYPETGTKTATFYVVSLVHDVDVRTHSTFMSSTNDYDSQTHYQLGRYLRYLYTTTGLNLFPFYNCYTSNYVSDVSLVQNSHYIYPSNSLYPSSSLFPGTKVVDSASRVVNIVEHSNSKYKVVAVPILFGHSYSILIDCPSQVLMRATLYNENGHMSPEQIAELSSDLEATLNNSGQVFPNMSFKEPVTYRVETGDPQSIMFQRNLYLLIQLPINNDSSIAIFENFDPTEYSTIRCEADGSRVYEFCRPSLARMNTRVSYAFSDRLIEYLLGNVIHPQDPVPQNIAVAQTLLASCYPSYKRSFITGQNKKGFWDKSLSSLILDVAEQNKDNYPLYDQDGYFNKDIQNIIDKRGE